MSRRWVVSLLVSLLLLPTAAYADPGDPVLEYGDAGEATIDAIASEVGIAGFIAAPDGRSILNFSPDPDVSAFAHVSADGAEVTAVALPGPGEANFGPGSSLFAAYRTGVSTTLAKYDEAGVLVDSFATDGETDLPVSVEAFPSALVADGSFVVVGGGSFDLDELDAWLVRADSNGAPDPNFGAGGFVSVLPGAGPGVDLQMVVDIHVVPEGYLVVVLTRGRGGDFVSVVPVAEDGMVGFATELSFTAGLFAVASTQLPDGSVIVGIETRFGDDDTFHLFKFDAGGAQDPAFEDPAFLELDLGSRIYLGALRTGEIALGYNVGLGEHYEIRLFDGSGALLGDFPIPFADRNGTYNYGIGPVWHDGGLLLATDPTAFSSGNPDDVAIAKFVADESGRFLDDDSSVHEADIEALAATGTTRGCDPPANVRFCPADLLVRKQLAALFVRWLGLPAATRDHFTDDNGSIFEDDINRLAEAGITIGCNPPDNDNYCPDDLVTRRQAAAAIVRALALGPASRDHFVDDNGSIFEDDINRLAEAGITIGCNPPDNDNYCPNAPIPRAEIASMIVRAMLLFP